MALFVLVILGLSLGWFASILVRSEAAGAILRQMGVGLVASLVAGSFMNEGSLLGGLSLFGLAAAVLVSMALLVMYHFFVTRRAGGYPGR